MYNDYGPLLPRSPGWCPAPAFVLSLPLVPSWLRVGTSSSSSLVESIASVNCIPQYELSLLISAHTHTSMHEADSASCVAVYSLMKFVDFNVIDRHKRVPLLADVYRDPPLRQISLHQAAGCSASSTLHASSRILPLVIATFPVRRRSNPIVAIAIPVMLSLLSLLLLLLLFLW